MKRVTTIDSLRMYVVMSPSNLSLLARGTSQTRAVIRAGGGACAWMRKNRKRGGNARSVGEASGLEPRHAPRCARSATAVLRPLRERRAARGQVDGACLSEERRVGRVRTRLGQSGRARQAKAHLTALPRRAYLILQAKGHELPHRLAEQATGERRRRSQVCANALRQGVRALFQGQAHWPVRHQRHVLRQKGAN